jgi:hypothetical protein
MFKNLEVDRLVLCAKQNKVLPIASTVGSDDELDERLDAILNHACGDLNENVLDTECDIFSILLLSNARKNIIMPKIRKMANSQRSQKPLLK